MPTPHPGTPTGRHRPAAPPARGALLTLLAVLTLVLGSGAAVALTAPPATPPDAGITTDPGHHPAALGAAPPSGDHPSPRPLPRSRPPATSPTGDPPSTTGAPDEPTDEFTRAEDKVTSLTNRERAEAGCGDLRTDERLRDAARGHSRDMATNDYFSHTAPDGRSPFDRMRAAGYPDPAAENIAMGYRTPADVVAGWMDSDGHRRNLLDCSYRATGVGLHHGPHGRPYWTQVFGR